MATILVLLPESSLPPISLPNSIPAITRRRSTSGSGLTLISNAYVFILAAARLSPSLLVAHSSALRSLALLVTGSVVDGPS